MDKKKRKKALPEEGGEYTYDSRDNRDYNRYSEDAEHAYLQLNRLEDPSKVYTQQLEDIYNQYVNRQPFSYDPENDPLYQNYRNQYVALGQQAMEDTQGRAAALTGGYSNTYGVSAGQQAYNAYLQQLSALIPELYGIAREDYQAEGDRLLTQYDMVGQMGSNAYDRYRDQVSDGWKNTQYLQGLADQAYDRGYENWWGNLQMEQKEAQTEYDRQQDALDREWAAQQQEYDRQQDALAQQIAAEKLAYEKAQDAANAKAQQDKAAYDRQQDAYDNLQTLIAAGYNPTDAELTAAGMTRAQANTLKSYYAAQNAPKSTGSSGSSGSSASAAATTTQKSHQDEWKALGKTVSVGTPSKDNIKLMQTIFGIGVDGYWGPISTDAAGGRTAQEAWEALNDGNFAWSTARAEKFYADKGTRAQWKARGVTGNEYDAMVTNWLKNSGLLPAEICWLKKQFAK